LSGPGVFGWFPVATVYHTTNYLWIRARAEIGEPDSDRPRPGVNLTLRGQALAKSSDAASRSRDWGWLVQVTGRGAGDPDGGVAGGSGRFGRSSASSMEQGRQSETKDIFRVGTRESHEFEHGLAVTVDLAMTTDPPQVIRRILDAARGAFVIGGTLLGRAAS